MAPFRVLAGLSPLQLSPRFLRFAFVGAMGTVTDMLVTVALFEVVGWHVIVAGVCGFVAAASQNFYLNRAWTFPEHRAFNTSVQMARFFCVSAVGFVVHVAMLLFVGSYVQPFFVEMVGLTSESFLGDYKLAKLSAIGVVLLWNFSANKFWTFK